MGIGLTISIPIIVLAAIMGIRIYSWTTVKAFEKKYKGRIPPGPKFYPIFGVLLEATALLPLRNSQVCKWFKQKYGDFAAFFAGQHYTFFMNDYTLVKEVMSNEIFSGRIPKHSITFINYFKQNLGILFSWGENAREMRSFSVRTFRKLNFGQKEEMNTILRTESIEFLNALDQERARNSNSVCLFDFVTRSVFAVMWHFMAGDSFPVTQKDMNAVCEALVIQDETTALGKTIEWYIPRARFIPWLTEFSKLTKSHEEIKEFFERVIKKKKDDGIYRDDPKDFIDYFLKEIEENKNNKYIHIEQLEMMCNDLLIAGIVTTANTITWAIYNIMRTPRVYSKLVQEIDNVLGSRLPDIEEDKKMLPYLDAVIHEALRMEVAVPVTSRTSTEPTEIRGYHIPPNALIVVDIDGMNKCPKLWENPQEFKPERFLDENMGIRKFEHFIPFGNGKRNCIGEKMARASLFFQIINFFQNYDFQVPNNVQHMDGISNNPAPFDVYITRRIF